MSPSPEKLKRKHVAWICPFCEDVITTGIEGEPIGDYRFIVETGHWHDGANHPAAPTRIYPESAPNVLSPDEARLIVENLHMPVRRNLPEAQKVRELWERLSTAFADKTADEGGHS